MGQGLPGLTNVIPPSPDAMAMQKYGDVPVSKYTGIPDISIPLYTVKFRDITLPISVSYHASGIKVQEEASSVGLGWALNAGGTISRNIIGGDDFKSSTYFTGGTINATTGAFTANGTFTPPADFMAGIKPYYSYNPGCVIQLTASGTNYTQNLQPYLDSSPEVEFQPDQYYFSFPGNNGKFILDRKYNAVLQKPEKIQISPLSTDGSTWRITGIDGFIYDYNKYETEHDYGYPELRKTAWYLTKVTSPLGSTVTLNYTGDNETFSSSAGEFYERKDVWRAPVTGYSVPSNGDLSQVRPGKIYNSIRLTSIDWEGGQVIFNYLGGNTTDRQDMPYAFKLNTVQVFSKNNSGVNNSSPLKTYTFAYGYFSGSGSPGFISSSSPTSPTALRLKLQQVTESGTYKGQTITSNPYVFSYYEGGYNDLPDKSSFSRDHWGYNNGYNSTVGPTTSLIPTFSNIYNNKMAWFYLGVPNNERDANPAFTKSFSLKSVKYPTGGSTTFEYETNTCDEQASEVNDLSGNPYLYSVIESPTNSTHQSQFSWYKIGGNPTQILDNRNVFDFNGQRIKRTFTLIFRVENGIQGVASIPAGYCYVSLKNMAGTEVRRFDPGDGYAIYNTLQPTITSPYVHAGNGSVVIDFKNLLDDIPKGKYTWDVVCTNNGYAANIVQVLMTYKWSTQVNSNPTYDNAVTFSYAGGLRIKRLTNHDGINTDVIRRFIYHYLQDKDGDGSKEEYSYGKRMSRPEYSSFETSVEQQVTHIGASTSVNIFFGEHLMRSSDSVIPLNGSAGGAVVGYDQVSELNGENGENGKTVYSYVNTPDKVGFYAITTNTAIDPQLFRKRPYSSNMSDPMNGTLLSQQDFKSVNGIPLMVKSLVNTYSTNLAVSNDVYGFEIFTPSAHGTDDTDPGSTNHPPQMSTCSDYLVTYSPLQRQWSYLSSTIEKVFGSADPTKFVQTTANYFYDEPKHYLPTRASLINSKGEMMTTFTSYPLDYTTFNPSDPTSNGIQYLIAKHVYNAPVEKYVMKTSADGFSNARVTSALLTTYRTDIPLIGSISQLQSVAPVTNFSKLSFTSTTTSKSPFYNPLVIFDSYDTGNGNLLQQHKNLNINFAYRWAYNKNYPIAQCKNAASNEFYFEGFEESSAAGVISGGHTGTYGSTTTTVNWTRPNSRAYVISYWYLSGGIWLLSPEQPYTGSTFNLSVTGATSYDDIRIYPADSELTTFTYDKLVGITSSTDPKGLTTFYEYDALQRLLNVKNADGDIVKNYQYHYQPQVQ